MAVLETARGVPEGENSRDKINQTVISVYYNCFLSWFLVKGVRKEAMQAHLIFADCTKIEH
jgi:hypothetical protein